MSVRVATEQDIPALVAFLIHRFHAEFADRLPPVSEQRTLHRVWNTVSKGTAFIAERDGLIVGTIGGIPENYWFSDAEFVNETWFYVAPEARRSTVARRLLDFLKADARSRGLPLVCGVTTGEDVERKDEFFHRAGLSRIGGIYHKE